MTKILTTKKEKKVEENLAQDDGSSINEGELYRL